MRDRARREKRQSQLIWFWDSADVGPYHKPYQEGTDTPTKRFVGCKTVKAREEVTFRPCQPPPDAAKEKQVVENQPFCDKWDSHLPLPHFSPTKFAAAIRLVKLRGMAKATKSAGSVLVGSGLAEAWA